MGRAALPDMIHLANAAGVPEGALTADPGFARELLAAGRDFPACGIDTILMHKMWRQVKRRVLRPEET